MARLLDDGNSQYLENTNAVIAATPLAIGTWFRCDDDTANQGMMMITDSDGASYWLIQLRGNVAGDPVRFRAYSDGSGNDVDATSGYTANTWHHVMGIAASATDRRVLLDGGNKGTTSTSKSPTAVDRTVLGAFYASSTPSLYFSGQLAESAIWDLSGWTGGTDAEKANEFERVAVPSLAKGFSPLFFPLGLVAYWHLFRDEDQDIVGGYDMTPINAPTIATHPPKMIYPAMPFIGVPTAAAGNPWYYYAQM